MFVNDEEAEELRSFFRWKLVEQLRQASGEAAHGCRGSVK